MEHRLRRKLLNSDTTASNKTYFKEIQERNEESLKAGLKFIKEQAKEVTGLFKASQQSLKFVGDTILSYHDARMDALKRERDYVLHSGELTGAAQKKAIEDFLPLSCNF